MKAHTKLYLKHFGYDTSDFIPCEHCGKTSVDIHHVDIKGMGGCKSADRIDNLIALCRLCHDKAHGIEARKFKEILKEIIVNRI